MDACKPPRRQRLLRAATFGIVAVLAMPAFALLASPQGEKPCSPLRDGDQVWLVSQRGLGCDAEQVDNLQYWRYDAQQGWLRSDRAEFAADDAAHLPTTIFVHGNRVSSCDAFAKGLSAYRALVRCADEQPLRFIVWSWPSDQIHGVLDDVRVKAARTNVSGYYLARFIDRLPDAPLSLWGHSFGARIVTGALHLLGGGQLTGRRLADVQHPRRPGLQVVLIVAALDNVWLNEGHFHGDALAQVDRILLVNNSCDAVLKRYHRLYHRHACQQALGYAGLYTSWLSAEQAAKVEQVDACCRIGREHTFAGYLCDAWLMAMMRNRLLADPLRPASENTVASAEAVAP
jgi:hypothetical protein